MKSGSKYNISVDKSLADMQAYYRDTSVTPVHKEEITNSSIRVMQHHLQLNSLVSQNDPEEMEGIVNIVMAHKGKLSHEADMTAIMMSPDHFGASLAVFSPNARKDMEAQVEAGKKAVETKLRNQQVNPRYLTQKTLTALSTSYEYANQIGGKHAVNVFNQTLSKAIGRYRETGDENQLSGIVSAVSVGYQVTPTHGSKTELKPSMHNSFLRPAKHYSAKVASRTRAVMEPTAEAAKRVVYSPRVAANWVAEKLEAVKAFSIKQKVKAASVAAALATVTLMSQDIKSPHAEETMVASNVFAASSVQSVKQDQLNEYGLKKQMMEAASMTQQDNKQTEEVYDKLCEALDSAAEDMTVDINGYNIAMPDCDNNNVREVIERMGKQLLADIETQVAQTTAEGAEERLSQSATKEQNGGWEIVDPQEDNTGPSIT